MALVKRQQLSHYRIMPLQPSLVSTQQIEFAMDYGHFTIAGASTPEPHGLLEEALATPPSAHDAGVVLVLSPHQNNFALPMTVETWTSAPTPDRDDWQQVSENPITVDERGHLYFESPTLEGVDCPIGPGDYILEASGRGFIRRGWPGSTAPGDEWRVRLWPRSEAPTSVPKIWKSSV